MATPTVDTTVDDSNIDDTTDTNADIDVLNISDEDFLKMEPPTVKVEATPDTKKEETTEDKDTATTVDDPNKDKTVDTTVIGNTTVKDNVDTTKEGDDTVVSTDDKKDSTTTGETTATNYEEEYKKLTVPFKANGVNIQVNSTDDIMSLMQMGANYHKKMTSLKPSLKVVKLLEQQGLLDTEKINYLIDLHNKNPEAVVKFIKESGVDPLTVDLTAESKYTPSNRSVSDTEMEIDTVLDSIKESPVYAKTLSVITEKWDTPSRSIIANNPHIISIINEQIASGIYDTVMSTVESERALGKLKGMSDLDAYKFVGDALHAKGLLGNQTTTKPAATKETTTATQTLTDAQRKELKQKASPTKTTATPIKQDFNPLAISDEEFAKLEQVKIKKA